MPVFEISHMLLVQWVSLGDLRKLLGAKRWEQIGAGRTVDAIKRQHLPVRGCLIAHLHLLRCSRTRLDGQVSR